VRKKFSDHGGTEKNRGRGGGSKKKERRPRGGRRQLRATNFCEVGFATGGVQKARSCSVKKSMGGTDEGGKKRKGVENQVQTV